MKLTPDQRKERDSMSAGLDRAAYPFSLRSIEELEAEIAKPVGVHVWLRGLVKKVYDVLFSPFV